MMDPFVDDPFIERNSHPDAIRCLSRVSIGLGYTTLTAMPTSVEEVVC